MRNISVFISLILFIAINGYFASAQSSRLITEKSNSQALLDLVKSSEVAYFKNNSGVAVLGIETKKDNTLIEMIGENNRNALELLQNNYLIIVDFDNEDIVVRSIDGIGLSEEDRLLNRKWQLLSEGKVVTVSPDEHITKTDEKLTWIFE